MDTLHLDKKTIEEFKERLLNRKKALIDELSDFAEKSSDEKGGWKTKYVDVGDSWDDNAFEVTEYGTNLSIEQTLKLRLKNINGALERIEKNTYGLCEKDGEPIPVERLKANPETKTCLEHSKS